MVVWYRWPGVEIMFIEARAGHAILRRWRLVDKARTFMQDCYTAILQRALYRRRQRKTVHSRIGFGDLENVKLFMQDCFVVVLGVDNILVGSRCFLIS